MSIGNDGMPTVEKCPKCGSTVVYNGNFFCSNWGFNTEGGDDGHCTWALPHPQTTAVDRQLSLNLQGYWESDEIVVRGEPALPIHISTPTDDDCPGCKRCNWTKNL